MHSPHELENLAWSIFSAWSAEGNTVHLQALITRYSKLPEGHPQFQELQELVWKIDSEVMAEPHRDWREL